MMKPIKHPSRRPVAAYAVRGFSLIEFLVASILSMIVLIAVGSGYFAARQLSDTALARLNVQQDLRNASNLIVRDARMAGSFGCFNMSAYDVAAVNETEIDEAAFRLVESGQNSLVPVKSLSAADFSPTGFTVGSNALVFQYGVGSASIINQNTTGAELQIPAGDPLQTATNNTPLVFTSCAVLDDPAAYGITVEPVNPKDVSEGFDITIDNINPALSTEQVTNEFAVLRYTVNAYVIGTAGTQQGLFRFQLDDSGQWGNPQLLMPAITAMNVQYGYVNNCAASGAASDATAVETFEFTDVLKTGNDADGEGVPPPALIRITLNGSNNVAAQTATGAAAGDVYVYNIDATVRGGNTLRRPHHLNCSKASAQQGFVLFIVLMMMIVIAFLVVAVTQSYNTEMRIGSNDADRKLAMSLAEAALRQGESDIADLSRPSFTQNCTNGLCAMAGAEARAQGEVTIEADITNVVAWDRSDRSCGDENCMDNNGRTYSAGTDTAVSRPARYIIEFVDAKTDGREIYRVTARAWGRNANTVVTVQSYVEAAS